MLSPKTCVYVLRSLIDRTRYYTGVTSNPSRRLKTHNVGGCPHTASGKPWEIDVLIEFADERRAPEVRKRTDMTCIAKQPAVIVEIFRWNGCWSSRRVSV